MPDRLRFHPLVALDLSAAIRWYGDISGGLGNRFRELVDSRFDDIEARPGRFGFAFDDVRFARVRRFPYVILFRETEQKVTILGVFHSASDPEKWQRRAEE
jgi:hypothetical protein